LALNLDTVPSTKSLSPEAACFAETPSRYLLEIPPDHLDAACRTLRDACVAFGQIGRFTPGRTLSVRSRNQGRLVEEPIEQLRASWHGTLDW